MPRSAGLCSADNDIIVLFVFAVTKYPRETSSQRDCLFWLRAIELLISDGEEKPGEEFLHGRQETEQATHRKGPGQKTTSSGQLPPVRSEGTGIYAVPTLSPAGYWGHGSDETQLLPQEAKLLPVATPSVQCLVTMRKSTVPTLCPLTHPIGEFPRPHSGLRTHPPMNYHLREVSG